MYSSQSVQEEEKKERFWSHYLYTCVCVCMRACASAIPIVRAARRTISHHMIVKQTVKIKLLPFTVIGRRRQSVLLLV